MADWDAGQYLKFETERTQPAIDLATRIPLAEAGAVLDVGCGPGNSTAVLARRFPGTRVLGIDSSPAMVAAAQKAHPGLRFEVTDVSGDLGRLGSGFDVVFSNACLQWVPDHAALVPKLLGLLRPGGVLAVQLPVNQREPIHAIITGLAQSGGWQRHFNNPRVFFTLAAEEYFDLLAGCAANHTLWETTYYHTLPNTAAIMEWYRGTGLRPYLDALGAEDAARFEQQVYLQVQQAYPPRPNGQVIFRFPRLFFLAMR